MATCRECIHDKACTSIFKYYGGRDDTVPDADKLCKCFEHKEKYVEQRHGQWLYGPVTGNVFLSEIYCSWCGKPAMYPDDEDRPLETDYCPWCGAKMDATKPDPAWPFYDMSLKEKMRNLISIE